MTLLDITQIIVSILLIASILLQQRGGGLSGVFGGESSAYSARRGAEKTIFTATIILASLFVITSVLRLFL